MRNKRLLLLALAVVSLSGGCKKKAPPETEAPTEAPTEQVVVTEAPTEAPTETEREDSMNRTRELNGLVVSNTADTLTIQTARGKQLEFSITGADIQLANSIQAGANVKLLYKGKVDDTDTSQAKVLMVVDLRENETPVTEGERMTEGEAADPEAGAGTLTGSISDLSADRVVILADDGDAYYFSIYDTVVNLANGFQEGNYVTLDYVGDIYGPDLVPAVRIRDNDPTGGDSPAQTGPSADGNYDHVSGTLSDITTSALTLALDDGSELEFATGGASQSFENGIAVGNLVTVEYTGAIVDGNAASAEVHAVYDAAGEGATGGEAGQGGATSGDAASGDAASRDATSGDAASGDAASGDATSGDAAQEGTTQGNAP